MDRLSANTDGKDKKQIHKHLQHLYRWHIAKMQHTNDFHCLQQQQHPTKQQQNLHAAKKNMNILHATKARTHT